MHFLMNEGYVEFFLMKSIKVDDAPVETYTDDELRVLLKKPNLRKCTFAEYRNWVITNLFFSTGIRQRSLLYLKVKDIDFDNQLLHVNVTKNRKPLIVPLSTTMTQILKEYLTHRQHKNDDEYLFCTSYGSQMTKGNLYHNLYEYNKARGVERTGIHRYRHTFAKQWILNGGNVVSLSKILGHSSLDITQNYLNILVSDVGKEVESLNLIDKFSDKKRIKMNTDTKR
jgi:integrase/recombinase XerD